MLLLSSPLSLNSCHLWFQVAFDYIPKVKILSLNNGHFILCFQANLEMLGARRRESQIQLKKDALCLQEQMTEFRNNVVKEVIAV